MDLDDALELGQFWLEGGVVGLPREVLVVLVDVDALGVVALAVGAALGVVVADAAVLREEVLLLLLENVGVGVAVHARPQTVHLETHLRRGLVCTGLAAEVIQHLLSEAAVVGVDLLGRHLLEDEVIPGEQLLVLLGLGGGLCVALLAACLTAFQLAHYIYCLLLFVYPAPAFEL